MPPSAPPPLDACRPAQDHDPREARPADARPLPTLARWEPPRWFLTDDGWLSAAHRRLSLHADDRPADAVVDTLVLHGISLPPGEFGGPDGPIDELFLGRLEPAAHAYYAHLAGVRVSAHLCIFRCGTVHQYVPFHRRAWHAGVSAFDGRVRVNDFSIGVEFEGTDDTPYTDAQYRSGTRAAAAIMAGWTGITAARIVGHQDIAPGRKTDPGAAFDWNRFLVELRDPR